MKFVLSLCFILCWALASQASSPASENGVYGKFCENILVIGVDSFFTLVSTFRIPNAFLYDAPILVIKSKDEYRDSGVADAYETTESNADTLNESSYEGDSALSSTPGGEVRQRRFFLDTFVKILQGIVKFFLDLIFDESQIDKTMSESFQKAEGGNSTFRAAPFRASKVVEACEKVKGQEQKVVRTAKGMKYLKATCRNALAVTFSARRPTPID
ncbi:hypothetical protein QAD02_010573 [Eretmocerus hayati]|uniref:Uncharacterized protein n=1 Tax=Eretmocerus hayati TaxID=131215 RepID=A0ACC2NX40_9HYME|nr:hypothetical protein QAD02_010573 [Eretmocerus hayati]